MRANQARPQARNAPNVIYKPRLPILVGINHPWGNGTCGWDFGNGPWGRTKWASGLPGDLAQYASLGIGVVRWFILAEGIYYGLRLNSQTRKFTYAQWAMPHPDTDRTRRGQWRLDDVPPLSPPNGKGSVVEDFEKLLEVFNTFNKTRRQAKKSEVLLLPSLISFEWCHPGNSVNDGLVKGGRSDVINDSSKRKLFFDGVLGQLLDASKNYKEEIFAWEIMNEPEGCTVMPDGKKEGEQYHGNCTVSEDHMKVFLNEAVNKINTAGFISTVGYRRLRTISYWNIPNVQLHQFHYYPNPGADPTTNPNGYKLEAHKFSPEYPCIIGEFGCSRNEITSGDNKVFHWPDLPDNDQDQGVYERLKLIESKKYPCALVWSKNASDNHSKWDSVSQNGVKRYTSSQ